jgi:photosystem II stability/assembly factor-like uncharacterized protein
VVGRGVMRELLWIVFLYVLAVVSGFSPKLEVSSSFKSPPQALLYFQDSSVVLYHVEDDGTVQRSDNDGQSWSTVQFGGKTTAIQYLIEHPYDSKIAYGLTGGDVHYVTKDQGSSWSEFRVPLTALSGPKPLAFHATQSGYVIVSGIDCPSGDALSPRCQPTTYYTKDSFASKPEVLTEAHKCMWGYATQDLEHEIEGNSVVCLFESDGARMLSMSSDFYRTSEIIRVDGEVLTKVLDFGAVSKYFVAATRHNIDDPKEIRLLVSTNLRTWQFAVFPNEERITETSFTILESSKHSLHVDVVTSQSGRVDEGTFYTSNSNGTFFRKSLERTSRSRVGLVDIEKLEGIDGVLIANVKTDDGIRTKISFDDGRSWSYLSQKDCNSDDCRVNLHAVLDHRNVGRIFSSPAPGIIAGIGNSGDRLKSRQEGDLYVSTDSGLTWSKALSGPQFYEFGDLGNVLLAIEDTEANSIQYSLDRGANWEQYSLKDTIKPMYLLTTPDSTSFKFLLVGTANGKPTTVAINFDGIHSSKCRLETDGSGDFEKWYARYDSDGNPSCVMGHKQYFWRKKVTSQCYVGDLHHEQFASIEDCTCTQEDYECDPQFIRDATGKCVPTAEYQKELDTCVKGQTYQRLKGYKLVPGNSCKKDGGVVLDGSESVVCGSEEKESDGKIKTHQFLFDGQIGDYFYLKADKSSKGDETIIVRNNYDEVFVTHDQGTTWDQILTDSEVIGLFPNPHFSNAVYAVTSDRKLYYSTDRAHSFNKVDPPASPGRSHGSLINFHPNHQDWLIYTGEIGCDNPFSPLCKMESFYSTDGGRSWKSLQENVQRCAWVGGLVKPTDERLIFCDKVYQDGMDYKIQLISSEDYFQSQVMHFDHIIGFALEHEFVVVASVRGLWNRF